jgi:predicted alpha/beta-hydrolase family hydrolase
MSAARTELRVALAEGGNSVSAILNRPADATTLLVFGHGAGAGMTHPFMERMTERLADRAIATLRYQFPYMEHRRSRPDTQPVLLATVRAAVRAAGDAAAGLPLIAGGKSMGGRMTSLAAAEAPLPGVAGLVFFGFPLHAAGSPGTTRAEHLTGVSVPMLFLQGTRDALADLTLLRPICEALGHRATLHELKGADHGFHVLKRSGRTDDDVLDELALTVATWSAHLTP